MSSQQKFLGMILLGKIGDKAVINFSKSLEFENRYHA